jgi:hypothetical protein
MVRVKDDTGANVRCVHGVLILAFVVLSALADSGATRGVVTGTVTEFLANEWIAVRNESTDPTGVRIALRETTAYEGSPAAIELGVRVTVSYRYVGEARPVADKVRVLPDAATR